MVILVQNILLGRNHPVILDAETACWGNPAFDLPFLNNHIILKSIFNKEIFKSYLKLSKSFLESYLAHFSIVNNKKFLRSFILLQALLILARVDGKSPVEYFKKKHKNLARNFAKNLLINKSSNLNNFFTKNGKNCQNMKLKKLVEEWYLIVEGYQLLKQKFT